MAKPQLLLKSIHKEELIKYIILHQSFEVKRILMINYKKIKCNVVAVVLNANISSWRALALLLQMALMNASYVFILWY